MKTFQDVAALVGELNTVAALGKMEFQVWNSEFNYTAGTIPEHLVKIARGNRFNKNKAVPGIRLKQWDATSHGVGNMELYLHMENQEAYTRLEKAINIVKESGLQGFISTYHLIESALKS